MTILLGNNAVSGEDLEKFHFGYIKPDEDTQNHLENARELYGEVLASLHSIPNSRERALAITKLEESLMFCTKAIVVASK